jgi:predicted TIM-barrel fold metal-dependent hydrolase
MGLKHLGYDQWYVHHRPFLCLAKTTKKSRILYSVDYPLSTNEEGAQFIDLLSKSGLVTDEELEMIAYRNAETLLKVKV